MRIAFIKSKTDLHAAVPPINFLYLAAYLKKHTFILIDGHNYNLSDDTIVKKVKEFNPEIICFGGLSSEIYYSLALAEKIKKTTKIKIIFGGVHTTNCSEEILGKNYVDFIFRAEAEIPFSEFVDKLEKKEDLTKVPNLGYKKNGKVVL